MIGSTHTFSGFFANEDNPGFVSTNNSSSKTNRPSANITQCQNVIISYQFFMTDNWLNSLFLTLKLCMFIPKYAL